MLIVDDHLLLRTLSGIAPRALRRASLATTSWWWRLVGPLARPRLVRGEHSSHVGNLSASEAEAVWHELRQVGQPGSCVAMPQLVPLVPAMAWLSAHHGLNRLAAEAIAAARDLGAGIRVSPRNVGRLGEAATRLGVDLRVVD